LISTTLGCKDKIKGITDFRHSFFLFILQGGGPSQVLGEGARPATPPLVAPLYFCRFRCNPLIKS